jgi:hypothetical protein
MTILSMFKRTALCTGSVAVLALSAGFASPASASIPARGDIPSAGSGCNQEICMRITTPYRIPHRPGLWVTVTAWERYGGITFEGHYDLINPRGNKFTTGGDRGWNHEQNAEFKNKSAIKGKWCVIGWEHLGRHHYAIIGEPCVTVR